MSHQVEESQDSPALLSWRQVSYTLLVAAISLSGFWLNAHIHDVETQGTAIIANQSAIIRHGEQIKTIYDNSLEARRWRDEEREWRSRIERHIDLLMREAGVTGPRVPGFSREKQTDGTKRTAPTPWDH